MEGLKGRIPFHCIITGPTNCGKTKYLIDQLRGHFRNVFDYVVLICPTYAFNETYDGFGEGDDKVFVMSPPPDGLEEINHCLLICSTLFEGTNTLLILDDCAVSKDLKNRSNEFINLAFSGRHKGLSVWVLTQQLFSISKPFRSNVSCIVSFFNPSEKEMKSLFEEFLCLEKEERKTITELLRQERFSRLCISLRHPNVWFLEIPNSHLRTNKRNEKHE